MAEDVQKDYEVSGAPTVTQRVSYARLADVTPTPTNPAQVSGDVAGKELTGVVLSLDAAKSQAVLDLTPGNVYYFKVRNVLTYGAGPAEATWGQIDEGDPIYYDDSAPMPAGVYLSTSPLQGDGSANSFFGRAVLLDSDDVFPKGAAGVGSTQRVAVMIVGAGGS